MKSSDSRLISGCGSWRPRIAVACVVVGSALTIMAVRPAVVQAYDDLRVERDVYALPKPEQMVVASLGYRAALADWLFAGVLVASGLHVGERRLFEYPAEYLETINALDPTFRAPYLYADTLVTLQTVKVPQGFYYKARRILERGMRERPNDAELWLVAGQYMAYVARPYVKPEDKQEWREAGARAMAGACERIGSNENIPYHCVHAASLLSKVGNRAATRRFLERVLAVSDDEEIRAKALGYLKKLIDQEARARALERLELFEAKWREDLPFVSKDALLALGPSFDVASCAAPERWASARCATTWLAWVERTQPAPAASAAASP